MFFDDHPSFLRTSETGSSAERLNMRYLAMIEANRDILRGARVLDLASHDGRWSLAALEAGAAHVCGVEARPQLVDHARSNFARYGVHISRYEFVPGDMFQVLADRRFEVDVVLCLGFVYHTLRYPELFSGIRRADPRHLVVDTRVTRRRKPVVELKVNRTGVQSNATQDVVSHRNKAIAGWPSSSALEMMLDVYDFDVESTFDWESLLRAHPSVPRRLVRDYERGTRITLRCRSREG